MVVLGFLSLSLGTSIQKDWIAQFLPGAAWKLAADPSDVVLRHLTGTSGIDALVDETFVPETRVKPWLNFKE